MRRNMNREDIEEAVLILMSEIHHASKRLVDLWQEMDQRMDDLRNYRENM
jgi:hypothetical protein